jgi:hypothetical protein
MFEAESTWQVTCVVHLMTVAIEGKLAPGVVPELNQDIKPEANRTPGMCKMADRDCSFVRREQMQCS